MTRQIRQSHLSIKQMYYSCLQVDATEELSTSEVDVHMAYIEQQQIDGADHTAKHAVKCKVVFDQRVNKSHVGEVVFEKVQLV